LLPGTVAKLSARGWVRVGGWIYIEQPARADLPVLPEGWRVHRSRHAGEVGYHLLQHTAQAPA
jgi:16S rRNA (guanine966-N2)-methyltransferase